MASDQPRRIASGGAPRSRAVLTLGWTLVLALPMAAWGQAAKPAVAGGIYTCIDSQGRRLTADRPIAECAHKEQQLLNRDGSVRAVVPATMTAEERALQETRDRAAAEARAAQADAVRRDRNLLARFPNEAAHNRAREAAADTVRLALKATELRLRELEAARKPLRDEAEFYQGKTLPAKLKAAIEANETSVEAQRAANANQEAELVRINKIYDAELERLRRLWGGAQPGTLGPLNTPQPAKPAR
jgi:hypothetical protein